MRNFLGAEKHAEKTLSIGDENILAVVAKDIEIAETVEEKIHESELELISLNERISEKAGNRKDLLESLGSNSSSITSSCTPNWGSVSRQDCSRSNLSAKVSD